MSPRKKKTEQEQNPLEDNAAVSAVPKKPEKKPAAQKKAPAKTEMKQEQALASVKNKGIDVEQKHGEIAAQSTKSDRGALILGGGMLFLGLLLLVGRLLNVPFGDYLWPFIFIVPGVLVFLTALSSESSSGEGLSILGGILTMLGAVFFTQSVTGLWASWAYAWALVAPASIGVSQMLYGTQKNREMVVQSGKRLANLGFAMFAIGFVFFELILGISGFGLRRLGLPTFPLILIFAGLVIIVRSFTRNR